MDFFEKTGKMAIGSRLRIFTDKITADASQIYKMYGVEIKPKWFPVIFTLSDGEKKTITVIAKEIGHTHPSVSNIVKEMSAMKLVKEIEDKNDKRKNAIALSPKGKRISETVKEICRDVETTIENISRESHNDLWKAIMEWEEILSEKSLLQRVKDARKEREIKEIKIIPYEPRFQPAFHSLNKEWITSYWQMEKADCNALEHPQEYIIDKGGYIFVGCYKGEPLGVCALCKMDNSIYDYELAKLAVSPQIQGKGMGLLLCRAVINKAKELGAEKIFLESNTLLKPALHIYKKLGFRELEEYHPTYKRGDIQMVLDIKQ